MRKYMLSIEVYLKSQSEEEALSVKQAIIERFQEDQFELIENDMFELAFTEI